MKNYKIRRFPNTKIASIDVCETGKKKHHVTGLVEFDATESRKKIREYNKTHNGKISFNAWLISVIAITVKKYETSASFLLGKNRQIVFDDINVSLIVEKDFNGSKVPVPLIIEKANSAGIEHITKQITEAKNMAFTEKEIVLQKKARKSEMIYYSLLKFLRRYFWRYLLRHPKVAYKRMGNVAFTSIGMMGKADGWFIPISIHPVCFGISSIIKKPWVINDQIKIRETLKMSILVDHDVMDGAPVARFITELSKNIESGLNI